MFMSNDGNATGPSLVLPQGEPIGEPVGANNNQ
jgi:hypothetical protein